MENFIIINGNLNVSIDNLKGSEFKIEETTLEIGKFYRIYKENKLVDKVVLKNTSDQFIYENGFSYIYTDPNAPVEQKIVTPVTELDGQFIQIFGKSEITIRRNLTYLGNICYFKNENGYIISNSIELLTKLLMESDIILTVNKAAQANTIMLPYYQCLGTYFDQINLVLSDEEVILTNDGFKMVKKNNVENKFLADLYAYDTDSFWEYVYNRYTNVVGRMLSELTYDNLEVDLTGGKDSRFILALIMKFVPKDKIIVRTTGSKHNTDLIVAQEITKYYQLKHNVGEPVFNGRGLGIDAFRYDFKYHLLNGNQRGKTMGVIINDYIGNIPFENIFNISGAYGNIINYVPAENRMYTTNFKGVEFMKNEYKTLIEDELNKIYDDLETRYKADKCNLLFKILYNKHNSSYSDMTRVKYEPIAFLAMDILAQVTYLISEEEVGKDIVFEEISKRVNPKMMYYFGREVDKTFGHTINEYNIQKYDHFLRKVSVNRKFYFFANNVARICDSARKYIPNKDTVIDLTKVREMRKGYNSRKYANTLEILYYFLYNEDVLNNTDFVRTTVDAQNEIEAEGNVFANISYKHNQFAYGLSTLYEIDQLIYGITTTEDDIEVYLRNNKTADTTYCTIDTYSEYKKVFKCSVSVPGSYTLVVKSADELLYTRNDIRVVEKFLNI